MIEGARIVYENHYDDGSEICRDAQSSLIRNGKTKRLKLLFYKINRKIMQKSALAFAMVLIIVLGLVLIYLGVFTGGGDLVGPPIVTGAGFLVIGWIFHVLRKTLP